MSPERELLISVIIPTFNAEQYLPDAIESVISQDYDPLEIIVVDDGSTDETSSVLARYDTVSCIRQENQGASVSRNVGIERAKGDLIAFLDADDIWLPGHVRVLLSALQASPEAVLVWGSSRVIDIVDGSVIEESWPAFLLGASLARRRAFELAGYFEPSLRCAQDLDWFAALRSTGAIHTHVDQQVQTYRKRRGSLTDGKMGGDLELLTMTRRAIARARAASQSKAA